MIAKKMNNLSNREFLSKYCYTTDDSEFVRAKVKEFFETCADNNTIEFLTDFFKTFIMPFFQNKDDYPELRRGFNRLRSDFMKQVYTQMQNIEFSNKFISKDFYDNYYSWLRDSGLFDTESGKAIADFQIANIFVEKYKYLYT